MTRTVMRHRRTSSRSVTVGPVSTVIVESGPVARVTLDRPEQRNALSLGVLRELTSAFRTLAEDPSVRVVVVAANGPAFSAGHDLREMVDERAPLYYAELFDECVATMQAIREAPQPVIARVHAIATAAGCQLVAACDLAIAAETARFATPGVSIGLFCSTPMVPLSRAIGRKRALEMLLTGEPISATTAADWGLVNRVVAPSELDDAVDALAAKIASAATSTIAIGKRAFYAQEAVDEDTAYGITAPTMAANAMTDDAQEGMAAFVEKRQPTWRT
jgi:enoyl-CoA hydratase/carnithine racemase